MNSVIGSLSSTETNRGSLDKIFGQDTQVRQVGQASVAVLESRASIASGDTWLCGLSGQIDNRPDLSVNAGFKADAPQSAASVVASLFARLGPEALGQLRGVFAGVFTDGTRLWSFRDQMGFWPMFHSTVAGQTVASDSIHACIAATQQHYRVNTPYLEDFFYGRIGSSTATGVVGVMRLRPGSWRRVGPEGAKTDRYWTPESLIEVDPPAESEIPTIFASLMTRAVDRVLTGADAVSLSGGIDSPVIAAFAAPQYQKRFGRALPAVSAVYPDLPSVDEEELIRLVADDLGMPLHTYRPMASATDDLPKWVSLLDGPVPVVSLAETLESLSVTKALGITNLITGEWAEYLFDMPQRTLAYLIYQGRWRSAHRYWGSLRERGVSTTTIVSRLAKDMTPFSLRKRRAQQQMGATTPQWIDRTQLTFHPRGPVTQQWRSNQAVMADGPSLGLEADHVVQMEAGTSIRRPFADVDLVEFFLRLPAEIKYPETGRKPLIRSLVRGQVPDRILDRTDKTLFDEAVEAGINYQQLEALLSDDDLMPGIDYQRLRQRITEETLDLVEYMWAKDLAAVHAFVSYASDRD